MADLCLAAGWSHECAGCGDVQRGSVGHTEGGMAWTFSESSGAFDCKLWSRLLDNVSWCVRYIWNSDCPNSLLSRQTWSLCSEHSRWVLGKCHVYCWRRWAPSSVESSLFGKKHRDSTEVPEIYGQMWFPRTACCWRVASSSSGTRPWDPSESCTDRTCQWRAAQCWSRPVRVNTCTAWPVVYCWRSRKVAGIGRWKRWAEIQLGLDQLMSQLLRVQSVHSQHYPRCFFRFIAGESMGEDGSSSHPGNRAEQQADFGQGEMGCHAPSRAGWSHRCSQDLWGAKTVSGMGGSFDIDMLFKCI